jgi:hypothetical protein
MYKYLAPGGIYITLSLHKEDDVVDYFMEEEFEWAVNTFEILNPRWETEKDTKRSVSHCLIICRKPMLTETVASMPKCPAVSGVLSSAELEKLTEQANEV